MSASKNTISFTFDPKELDVVSADSVILAGQKTALGSPGITEQLPTLLGASSGDAFPYTGVVTAMLAGAKGGVSGASAKSHVAKAKGDTFLPVSLCVLPATVSRNNHPLSVHVLSELLASARPDAGKVAVYVCGASRSNVGALASAVAKAMPPLYNRKLEGSNMVDEAAKPLSMKVCFLDADGLPLYKGAEGADVLVSANACAEGVLLAAKLVDMAPAELTTAAYAKECIRMATELGPSVTFEEIVGDELLKRGYGGIHAVGRQAECPPRLIIMTYTPSGDNGGKAAETLALVGKGIVYDAGGLSLKPTLGMCGMKCDMGGSAGLFGGFCAAVRAGLPQKITLLLCVAENAIGPAAFRNDDVLSMYSGKTVEVNNTDAEGRLVLADGVAHATKHIAGLDTVVNMCTLTGAQLITTGKKHAGILSNTEASERRVFDAGMASGDLCFPMLYCPELLNQEFTSKVADMKNSVKQRNNAQSSCAGHFIESHLSPDYKGAWIHIDMAGPSSKDERATGYGVGLVLSLLKAPGF